jgi:hypothetical protein
MTTFAAISSTLDAKAPDPTKHVNYTLGMVLGVDDFNQEFAYLAGRDRWLARDAIGYGTLNGLNVSITKTTKGPQLVVSSGAALTPRGQLVCVKPTQCAYLNDWLAANKSQVAPLLGSPLAGTISLYLTLCYRDCPVDLVPIPGEPCRSEDELTAPSRLADSFLLDLRTAPPDQAEEDLLREFVAWLRMLPFGGGGPYATIAEFEDALRNAAQPLLTSPPSSPLSSPPSGPIHFVFGSPVIALKLDPTLAGDYFRAAFGIWIEEIRPKVHAACAGSCGCCSGSKEEEPKTDECLLLARVDVPVVSSSGNWVADDTHDVVIDESRRPLLVHLRLLQELITTAGPGGIAAGLGGGVAVVAAGIVGASGPRLPVFNKLAAEKIDKDTIRLTFPGYALPPTSPPQQYIVKCTPLSDAGVQTPMAVIDHFDNKGVVMRIVRGTGAALTGNQIDSILLSVEISRIG